MSLAGIQELHVEKHHCLKTLETSGFPLKTRGNDGKVWFLVHPRLNVELPYTSLSGINTLTIQFSEYVTVKQRPGQLIFLKALRISS